MRSLLRRLANGLLTVGALLGAACVVLVVLGPLVGVSPLLFRSGSMTPAIHTGDLALARSVSARDLAVGDIVSVRTSGGARVTHRVVDIQHQGDEATLTLQGDANEGPDAEHYRVTQADRVIVVLPWVGRVVAAAESPLGIFVLGVAAAGLLALVVRGPGGTGGGGDIAPRRRHRSRRRARAGVVTGATMAVAVGVTGPASGAVVPWTDPVDVTGSAFVSTTVPAPTLSCGALGLLSVTFNWTAVSGATGYQLTAGGTTYAVAGTTKTITAVITGGTATVKALRDFGSTTWTSAASNQRTYTVAAVSLCS
ncbi:signal peptidase I [Nocardioides panacisoli]|uniref:Signal peptidase I n=1 Tax=Nocardioides panacisoli TaxID=627624 RepID=A0ABP7J1R3_9ACTN